MGNYNINNNIINIGDNMINITKNYYFSNPEFFLDINNKKFRISSNKISNTEYQIKFYLSNKAKTKLLIRDGIIEEYLVLYHIQEDSYEPNTNIDDIKINAYFLKDKIFLQIKKPLPLKKDTSLKFEGDINKTVFWRQNTKEIEISFPYQVKGYTTLTFKLNNIIKKVKVFNRDDFPKNLIKIKGGLKLNKICDWDLRLVTETKEWIIKKGDAFIYFDIESNETFKVYIDEYLLFEQKILASSYLPKITLLEDPLRIKLSQPFYENVVVKFKNINERWVITQGKTEVIINCDKGIRLLEIEDISNAISDNKSWIYHIK